MNAHRAAAGPPAARLRHAPRPCPARRRHAAAGVLAVVALLAAPGAAGPAAAGTLTAYLGATPDGTAAAIGPWTGLNAVSAAGFGVAVPAGSPLGWSRTATLSVPPDLTLAGAVAERAYEAPPSSDTAQSNVVTSWDAHGYPYSGCIVNAWGCGYVGESGSGTVSVAGGSSSLSIAASCVAFGAGGGSCYPGAWWSARRMELRLGDVAAPTATLDADPGELVGGGWLTAGSSALALTAADRGAGVYRAFFREGATTTYVPLDPAAAAAGCTDARPAVGDAYEFAASATALVPCPTASAGYHPTFDLSALGDGVHLGAFGVEDATGTETLVAPATTVRVNAPGGALADPGQPCLNGVYDVSGACVARPPSSTTPPALGGDAEVGGHLTTDAGTWADASGATTAYAWELCDAAGAHCTAIAGQSGTTVSVEAAAAGSRIRSVVSVTTAGGTTRAVSALTPIIQRDAPSGSGGAGAVDAVPELAVPGPSGPDPTLRWFETHTLDLPTPIGASSTVGSAANGRGYDGGPVALTAAIATPRPTAAETVRPTPPSTTPARPFGARTPIMGHLTTASGAPIRDAQIDVIVHAARPDARGTIAGASRTDDDGAFVFDAPAGGSRIYSFGFRPRLSDTVYLGVAHVLVAVRSRISLRTSARRLGAGHSARLWGAVAGPPARSRQLVRLQALHGRHWTTFAAVRLRSGRFAYRTRFTRTRRTTTYPIRATVARDARQPLEAAHSPTIRITVTRPRSTRANPAARQETR